MCEPFVHEVARTQRHRIDTPDPISFDQEVPDGVPIVDPGVDTPFRELDQHINWCIPNKGDERRWAETRGGKPIFGPRGPIATEEVCAAVKGRFVPHLFGWMVHVNAFESDDPAVIWGDHH